MDFRNIINPRDIAAFFYLVPLRMMATVVSPKVIQSLSRPFVHLYCTLPSNKKRRDHIREMLGSVFSAAKTDKDIRRLTVECYRNSIYTLVDDIVLNKISRNTLMKAGEIEGIENLEEALSHGKGALLVGGHFTGDRLGKRLLREIGFPILSVRTKSPVMPSTSLIAERCIIPAISGIWDSALKENIYIEDSGFSLDILKKLRGNGIVSILIDTTDVQKGFFFPFLGKKRLFPANFLQIAHLTGAAVLPSLFIGNSTSFKVVIEKKIGLQQFEDKETFLSANLGSLVKIFEAHVIKNPTQWLVL